MDATFYAAGDLKTRLEGLASHLFGDQLAIGKEIGRCLGMGTNMYPSSSLLGDHKDASLATLSVKELIEKADGFAGVFPEHKYEIVKILQGRKHITGMTGDGVNDAPALKIADIGIAVADATDAARSASDIVLIEPGLSVIISTVLTSRAFWRFNFPHRMVLVIAILNDGIMERDGLVGLYMGFVPNALKTLPNNSIRPTTFDTEDSEFFLPRIMEGNKKKHNLISNGHLERQ